MPLSPRHPLGVPAVPGSPCHLPPAGSTFRSGLSREATRFARVIYARGHRSRITPPSLNPRNATEGVGAGVLAVGGTGTLSREPHGVARLLRCTLGRPVQAEAAPVSTLPMPLGCEEVTLLTGTGFHWKN